MGKVGGGFWGLFEATIEAKSFTLDIHTEEKE